MIPIIMAASAKRSHTESKNPPNFVLRFCERAIAPSITSQNPLMIINKAPAPKLPDAYSTPANILIRTPIIVTILGSMSIFWPISPVILLVFGRQER